MTIRVLIADDQELVRTGLSMILDAQPDIEVVGEAIRRQRGGGARPQPAARTSACSTSGCPARTASRRPAPSPGRASRTRWRWSSSPRSTSTSTSTRRCGRARRASCSRTPGRTLLGQAVRAAASGDALIAPNVTVRLLEAFAGAGTGRAAAATGRAAHRPRGAGARRRGPRLSNSEIASELYITLSTVKTHLASLMTKLGARNRVEIAIWAHQTNRIPRRR